MAAKIPAAGISTYNVATSDADLGAGIHIKTGDSGGSATSTADELVVEGSGDTGIQILSGASSEAGITFGDSGDSNVGLIGYDHANNRFRFKTNDAVQWYLDSSGNWLPAATDHGIYLGVTSATASNLLDDYEEGDCTFGFTTASGAMTMNGTYKYGKYTKVGNLVTVTGYAIGSALGSATANQGLTMTGLPFSIIGENGAYSSMDVSYGEGLNITAGYHIGGYARINYATVPLLIWDSTAGTTSLLQSELSNNGGFIFSIMYYVS